MNVMILIVSFNNSISWADCIGAVSLLLALIGGYFALIQWRMNMKLKRAEYIKNLLDQMRTDKDIVYYKFDYDEPWYGPNFHNSGESERKMDYTLNFFSYICYLRNHKIINKTDFCCFKYEIERILTNRHFLCYCYNLYHWSKKIKQPIPFYELFEYARKHHYFDKYDKEFWNNQSKQYPHYLNF